MSPQPQQLPTRMTTPAMAHQTPPPCARPAGMHAKGSSVSPATGPARTRPAARAAAPVAGRAPAAAPKRPADVKRAEGVSHPTATDPARARPAIPEVQA